MSLGETIESLLHAYRKRRLVGLRGPLGDFFRAGGNSHLMDGLSMREDDTVLDVGGFRGDWTADVLCRFGCRSIIMEPVPEFQAALKSRFGLNSRVKLVEAGLGIETGTVSIAVNGDSSSSHGPATDHATRIPARIIGVGDLWRELAGRRVACMKINIEGAEYDLLDAMAEKEFHRDVGVFLIQFHPNVDDYERRRQSIREGLARTHANDLDYPFVWERWVRKGP